MAQVVFYMQVGFTMFEVGSVRAKNTKNILLKNILDVSIGRREYRLGGGR